jgi:acyl-coenzyme A thioesterase PaaI-like protein
MKESLRTKIQRHIFNFHPIYRKTGGRITFISEDYKCVKMKLPLNWTTRNIKGTIFGGSMYASIDPIYMIMFMKILGDEYIVWDKAANIDFLLQGRETLTSTFNIDDKTIRDIKEELEHTRSITKLFKVELINSKNEVCARIEKNLYFRKV